MHATTDIEFGELLLGEDAAGDYKCAQAFAGHVRGFFIEPIVVLYESAHHSVGAFHIEYEAARPLLLKSRAIL